jgi:guanidinoacetate N-methyltransferase
MTRKLKRARAFDLTVEIKDEAFLRPPHEFQRNWLLNRFLREAADDLMALDAIAPRFVPGGERDLPDDLRSAELTDTQIMEDWQLRLMEAMSRIAARSGGDVLEVGFGRGVSATLLQRHGVRSHTIIECNQSIIDRFERWRAGYPDRDVRIVPGLWQEVIGGLGQFDAIFFHTYALDEDESVDLLARSVTFAAHFFPAAAEHLRPGGVFTYLTGEIDSLSRAHQRLLFEHFSSFRVERVALDVPADVQDAWWADSMVVIEAVK